MTTTDPRMPGQAPARQTRAPGPAGLAGSGATSAGPASGVGAGPVTGPGNAWTPATPGPRGEVGGGVLGGATPPTSKREILTDHNRTAQVANPRAPWRTRAACLGKAQIMDRKQRDRPNGEALALCRNCPVLDDCKAWVLSLPDTLDPGGICAGLNERQRMKIRPKRHPSIAPDAPRTCAQCGWTGRTAEFPVNSGTVRQICKTCWNAHCRDYRNRKRGAPAAVPGGPDG
jgi:hypothetical protein